MGPLDDPMADDFFIPNPPLTSRRAKLGKIQGGEVAEDQPRFDKGGVANFFTFYAIKISLFRVSTLSD